MDQGTKKLVHVFAVELAVNQVHVFTFEAPEAQQEVHAYDEASIALHGSYEVSLFGDVHAIFAQLFYRYT